MDKKHGFTLLELMIVMVLLSILALVGIPYLQGSQRRGRDGKRKADLAQVAKALEMYANDAGVYPESAEGKIVGCGGAACAWGTAFMNGATVYMQQLPKDPLGYQTYYYETVGNAGKEFRLWTRLESADDPGLVITTIKCSQEVCNYAVRSPNSVVQ